MTSASRVRRDRTRHGLVSTECLARDGVLCHVARARRKGNIAGRCSEHQEDPARGARCETRRHWAAPGCPRKQPKGRKKTPTTSPTRAGSPLSELRRRGWRRVHGGAAAQGALLCRRGGCVAPAAHRGGSRPARSRCSVDPTTRSSRRRDQSGRARRYPTCRHRQRWARRLGPPRPSPPRYQHQGPPRREGGSCEFGAPPAYPRTPAILAGPDRPFRLTLKS
jgi:hypothetical protein